MSKALVILNEPAYGSERIYNGLRLATWTGEWADRVVVF